MTQKLSAPDAGGSARKSASPSARPLPGAAGVIVAADVIDIDEGIEN